ncbi:MAG: hypothetical protein GY885_13515, partial [Phycisphaeraceae bacterium]|nr:hypothetical protein [Phycisphaeraceae bacterium]
DGTTIEFFDSRADPGSSQFKATIEKATKKAAAAKSGSKKSDSKKTGAKKQTTSSGY